MDRWPCAFVERCDYCACYCGFYFIFSCYGIVFFFNVSGQTIQTVAADIQQWSLAQFEIKYSSCSSYSSYPLEHNVGAISNFLLSCLKHSLQDFAANFGTYLSLSFVAPHLAGTVEVPVSNQNSRILLIRQRNLLASCFISICSLATADGGGVRGLTVTLQSVGEVQASDYSTPSSIREGAGGGDGGGGRGGGGEGGA